MSISWLRVPLFVSWLPFATFGFAAAPVDRPPPTHRVAGSGGLAREPPRQRELRSSTGAPVGLVREAFPSAAPSPLVVGVHGANSRPEFICENLFEALGPEPFIVCPHASSHLEWDACWGNGAPLVEAVDRAVQAALETYGERIDTRHLVFFGHSLGAMKIPDAYAYARPRLPFAAVVIFEGMPKDDALLERAVRNLGVTQALFVSGQDGWRSRHAAAATSLSRHGLSSWHVAGSFGHSFVDGAFDIVRREVPLLWEPSV